MIGTDVDELSLQYAQKNVANNNLDRKIGLRKSTLEGPILHPLSDNSLPPFQFTMCNPPFYRDREDVTRSAEEKEFDPHAVCTGADVEMITAGGEVEFVGRMLAESLQLRDRCRWFTSLLGKMSSLAELVGRLQTEKIDNYAITELIQGHTRRWVIAWSFQSARLPDSLGRPRSAALQHLLLPPNTLTQTYGAEKIVSTDLLLAALLQVMSALPGVSAAIEDVQTTGIVIVTAQANTWSRAARRKQKALEQLPSLLTLAPPNTDQTGPAIICEIRISLADDNQQLVSLSGTWKDGQSRSDFESFWSHVTRKVADGISRS